MILVDLPPLPVSVSGARGPLTVEAFTPIEQADGSRIMGDYDESTRRIRVGEGLPPEYRWTVFFHEVVHAALQDSGLHNLLKPKVQEAVCDALATALLHYEFGDRQDPEMLPDAPEGP